jgi:hypothetical protein
MKHKDWRSRFWSKVDMSNRAGCWNWTASISKNGYGSFKLFGKAQTTSRVAYWIGHGTPAGEMMVLHTCDNRACCNPAHLYLGDVKQNTRDMMERGRHRSGPVKGEQNGNAKLSEADVLEIKRQIAAGDKNQAIADRFGATHQMISKIRNGHFWKHVGIEKGEAA